MTPKLLLTVFLLFTAWASFGQKMNDLASLGNRFLSSKIDATYSYRYLTPRSIENKSIVLDSNPSSNKLFHGSLPNDGRTYLESEDDYELYQSLFIQGVLNIKRTYALKVGLSYHHNTDYYGRVVENGRLATAKNKVVGMGNFIIGADKIFSLGKSSSTLHHLLSVGYAGELPTGKHEVSNIYREDAHVQPAKSVYSSILVLDYLIEKSNYLGLVSNITIHLPHNRQRILSTTQYTYGRAAQIEALLFKSWQGRLCKSVLLGFNYAYTGQDIINQYTLPDTGEQYLNALLGTKILLKNTELGLNTLLPLLKEAKGDQLIGRILLEARATIYLNRKND